MRKLVIVAILLIAVLLISWWAKGANFSLFTMMKSATLPQSATDSATIHSKSSGQAATPIPVEIIITVTPNGFVPDVLMITTNTKITWINKTPITANISSSPEVSYPPLNLGDFGQNGSVSLVFPKAGRFNYYNNKNPVQKGTLVVK